MIAGFDIGESRSSFFGEQHFALPPAGGRLHGLAVDMQIEKCR